VNQAVFSLLLVAVGGLLYAAMAVALLRNRTLVGARLAGFAAATAAGYIVTSQIVPTARNPLEQYLAISAFYTTAALIVPAVVAFVLYAGQSWTPSTAGWLVLLAIPLVTIALVWTNPIHELMWAEPPTGPTGRLRFVPRFGWWATWVYLPAQWGGLAAAVGVLARSCARPLGELGSRSRLTRVESAITLLAVLAPFLVNVYAVAIAPNPASDQSRTAVTLAISSLVLLAIFLRLEIIGLERVAYSSVVRASKDGFLLMDARDTVVRLNQAATRLLTFPATGALGQTLDAILVGAPQLRSLAMRSGEVHEEVAVDGDRHRSVSFQPLYSRSGEYRGRTLTIRDITERRQSELALRESETLLRSIVEHSPNGVIRLRPLFSASSTSLDFECTFANPAAGYYLGIDHKDLVGKAVSETVPVMAPTLLPNLLDALRQGITNTFDIPVPIGAGNLWFRVIASPVGDDLSVTIIDVTDERLRRLEAEGAASEDPLTGLLNRRGLETAVQRLPVDQSRRAIPAHALLFIDLDRFKEINDQFGHTAGDHVLREFAHRLRAAVRETDVVARVGGDEFVVILINTDPEASGALADRILGEARRPYRVPGGTASCGASIGIARLPRQGQLLTTVLQSADAAMYHAKTAGGGVRVAGSASMAPGGSAGPTPAVPPRSPEAPIHR